MCYVRCDECHEMTLHELNVMKLNELVSVIKGPWKVSAFTGNVDGGDFFFYFIYFLKVELPVF